MIDVNDVLGTLAKQRPIFHSEADFQHSFAWEIHQRLSNASIRLELPIPLEAKTYLDVWASHGDSVLAVELKYKTRALTVLIGNEQFSLANHSAQDCGRHDFIKDIQRLEKITAAQKNAIGYAILLTNDSAYWKAPRDRLTVDAEFRLHEGRVLRGQFNWGAGASEGTKRNREEPLSLQGEYVLNWEDYSPPSATSTVNFRYFTIEVR